MISKSSPLRNGTTGRGGQIHCAFITFVVTQAVGMDAMRSLSAIEEIHDDGVANFSPDCWPENTQPFRLRFARRERRVRVLDVAGLRPSRLQGPGAWDRSPMNQVPSTGSEVPRDIFRSDVVVAGRCSHARRHGKKN